MEKILFLEKERGRFEGIPESEIPNTVFAVSVERYFDKTTIDEAAQKARKLSARVLATIPEDSSQK